MADLYHGKNDISGDVAPSVAYKRYFAQGYYELGYSATEASVSFTKDLDDGYIAVSISCIGTGLPFTICKAISFTQTGNTVTVNWWVHNVSSPTITSANADFQINAVKGVM